MPPGSTSAPSQTNDHSACWVPLCAARAHMRSDLEKQQQELESLFESEKQNGEEERRKLQADYEERIDALQEEITVCGTNP